MSAPSTTTIPSSGPSRRSSRFMEGLFEETSARASLDTIGQPAWLNPTLALCAADPLDKARGQFALSSCPMKIGAATNATKPTDSSTIKEKTAKTNKVKAAAKKAGAALKSAAHSINKTMITDPDEWTSQFDFPLNYRCAGRDTARDKYSSWDKDLIMRIAAKRLEKLKRAEHAAELKADAENSGDPVRYMAPEF